MPTKDGKHAYTDEEKAEIIAHVLVNVACGRFVSRIFREDDLTENGIKLPAISTFWLWVFADDDGELSDKLTRAREAGVEVIVDETVEIADDKQHDSYTDDNGIERANTEWITRSRLRVDTRLKIAAMLKPRKYGPKLDLTSGGDKISMADEVRQGIALARAKRAKEGEDE